MKGKPAGTERVLSFVGVRYKWMKAKKDTEEETEERTENNTSESGRAQVKVAIRGDRASSGLVIR